MTEQPRTTEQPLGTVHSAELDEAATELAGADAEVSTRAVVEGGVVVGHDGSGCAQEALECAAALAQRADWPPHVVRARRIAPDPQPSTCDPGYAPPTTD